jgi:hypothetical protein
MGLFDNNFGAEFSQCGKYRYKLWRIWDESLPKAMCIGLNPSTANASKNDNTINVLIKVLGKLGYGGFYMMNCWAYITSDPKLLKVNPMSDEWNNNTITVTASICDTVIFAWGNFEIIREKGRDAELIEMFPNAKCFGKNQNGTPWHPRALSYKGLLNNPELKSFLP